MSKYVVAVFPSEAKAHEGSQAFKELHDEGSLTLFNLAVIAKDGDGKVSVKESPDERPTGTAAGLLVGGLVGLLGGPVGVAVGATGGGLLGMIGDLTNAGVGVEFVDAVSKKMEAGSVAVLAEVDEPWVTPVNMAVGKLGGTVIRRNRSDFADQQFENDIQSMNSQLDALNAELNESPAEARAELEAEIAKMHSDLQAAQDKAKARVAQLENEAQVKVEKLQDQASHAASKDRAKINKRIEELETDYYARRDKLLRACGLPRKPIPDSRLKSRPA